MLALEQLQKSFGTRTVLDSVQYRFPDGEKLALVGANGAGKTTLLNIICGLEQADAGRVVCSQGLKLGYLPQEPEANPKETILFECIAGHRDIFSLKEQMEQCLDALQKSSAPEIISAYEKAESQFAQAGGYSLEAKASGILQGLGFQSEQILAHPLSLSGGWRMRLELAKVFLNEPDVLILDEPTNHLDLPSLVWVEKYLQNFRGTLLFVSHDRSLLNRLATITLYLSFGQLKAYKGNFDALLEQREMEEAQLDARRSNLEKQREHLEAFVDRFGAKASKARQAQSKAKQIDKIRSLENNLLPMQSEQTFHLKLPEPPACSREVLRVEELSIGYGEKILATKIHLLMERGAKVAIIGSNGIGKSTFLKTVAAQIPALKGSCLLGQKVLPAYFAQNHGEILDLNKSIIENVMSVRDDLGEKEARQILGSFLFSGDDVFKKVKVLSGGEKARVALCRSLVCQANFLMLDEPTNHLDMSSVEVLIEGLSAYTGTLLFVSHDRSFIDALATHIFVMLPDGRSALFHGKLDDYQRLAAQSQFPNVLDQSEKRPSSETPKTVQKPNQSDFEKSKQAKRDRSKLQKAMEKLETRQHHLRANLHLLEKELAHLDPNQYQQAQELHAKLQAEQKALEQAEEEWLGLAEELEQCSPS